MSKIETHYDRLHARTVALLYVLVRDHLPASVIEDAILGDDVVGIEIGHEAPDLTCVAVTSQGLLLAWAVEMIERLDP